VKSSHARQAALPSKRLLSAMILAALAATGSVQAGEIKTSNPDLVLRWDNTVRVNLADRIEGQDPSLLASPNFDDGDRNFEGGIVSERLDLLSEFDLTWKDSVGFRVSAAGWYDYDYHKGLDNDHVGSSNHVDENGQGILGLSDPHPPLLARTRRRTARRLRVRQVQPRRSAGQREGRPPHRVLGRSDAQPGA
jgi:hypothetical protein